MKLSLCQCTYYTIWMLCINFKSSKILSGNNVQEKSKLNYIQQIKVFFHYFIFSVLLKRHLFEKQLTKVSPLHNLSEGEILFQTFIIFQTQFFSIFSFLHYFYFSVSRQFIFPTCFEHWQIGFNENHWLVRLIKNPVKKRFFKIPNNLSNVKTSLISNKVNH